jgi:hypothetical protein
MAFTLSAESLRRLSAINGFSIPAEGMVFFGLRGCLPVTEGSQEFQWEHSVELTPVDYLHPRCTIGQWLVTEGQIALFPGSTAPHLRYVKKAVAKGGAGVNQLMTGYYKDYRKGVHKAGAPTAHQAFRQVEGRPLRRTGDDSDYDNDDRVEFGNPYDNLHAAWSMGGNHEGYASLGCQVVVGYPRCPHRGNQPDVGPWKEFKSNAYSIPQESFPYLLLTALDARNVAASGGSPLTARLRFGSQSPLVSELQTRLKDADFYEGAVDGSFGERTLRAVLAFQIAMFGPEADDGIVGPVTASALGMDWPKF